MECFLRLRLIDNVTKRKWVARQQSKTPALRICSCVWARDSTVAFSYAVTQTKNHTRLSARSALLRETRRQDKDIQFCHSKTYRVYCSLLLCNYIWGLYASCLLSISRKSVSVFKKYHCWRSTRILPDLYSGWTIWSKLAFIWVD